MKKELRISIFIIVITLVIGSIGYMLKTNISPQILLPTAESYSVFEFLMHKKHPNKYVYGFLPNWSLDKLSKIRVNYLTDVAYFGIRIKADGNLQKYTENGETEPGFNQWQSNENLAKFISKAQKEGTRVALTIISHDDTTSDSFLNCESCWNTLLQNTIEQLDHHHIKDVNLNFEYASYTDKETAIKYTRFVNFMNENLDKKYGESFVVVSVFADSVVKPRVTDISGLSKVADGLFIMAYDFHRPDSDTAGPVAPIGGKGVYAEYDIQTMLEDFVKQIPADKLILGVPYYGYNWVTETQDPYATRIPGNDFIGYSQSQTYETIMETIEENNIQIQWDGLAESPYFSYVSSATGSNRTVYFDNKESLQHKYFLAKKNNLGGIGIWALGYDGARPELWNLIREEFMITQ